MSYISITNAGNDHSIWRKGLEFYSDEIKVMQNRLTEVSSKNNSFEARQGIEHFQNQFLLQRNNIDELNHDINLYVQHIGGDALSHQGRVEKSFLAEHDKLQEKYKGLENILNDLRHEFNSYLGKWM